MRGIPRDARRSVERFCSLNANLKTARVFRKIAVTTLCRPTKRRINTAGGSKTPSRPLYKACRGAPRLAANRAHEGASLACLTPQRVAAAGAALLAAAAAAAAVAAAAAAAAAAAEAAAAAATAAAAASPPEPAPSAPPSPFTPAPPCCFAVQTGKVDDKILVLGKKIDDTHAAAGAGDALSQRARRRDRVQLGAECVRAQPANAVEARALAARATCACSAKRHTRCGRCRLSQPTCAPTRSC